MVKHYFSALLTAFTLSLHGGEIPEGFKIQTLIPLGGEILMPESWYFDGGMTEDGFEFIISKEKYDDGSYDTGLRIQGILGVKKKTDFTPYQAAIYNREFFKSRAIRIIMECEEDSTGQLKKLCLETIEANPKNHEDNFRVLYSFLWYDDLDLLVATIFGTPESKWDEMKRIYYIMQDIKLIYFTKINTAEKQDSSAFLLER